MIKKIALFIICLFLLSSFALAANFGVGDPISVQNTGASGLNVRDQPSTSGVALFKKFDGNQGSVLSGPTFANSYTWWKIRWSDGQEGYSADGDATGAWLTKWFVSPSIKFSVGNTAQVSGTGGSNLNVRGSPPDLAFIGSVGSTAQGSVVAGPFYGIPKGSSGFYHFWQVNFGSITGWVAEDFLTKIQTTTVPSAPQNLGASAGDQYVSLSWNPPANNGGATVTLYKIYRGTSPGGETLYSSTSATTFFEMSVLNGVTYYYKVSAVNAIGESALSNEVSATPFSIPTTTVPSAPINLVASGGANSATLSWNVPSNNGGASITSYKVYRSTASGQESFYTSTSATSFSDTSVSNGITYYYKVSAVNSVGEGSLSGEASVIPFATPVTTVPSAPTNLAASGTTSTTLSWNVPSNNGGMSITSYRVYRGTSSGGESLLTTTSSNSYVDGSVSPSTTYYYKVSAVNSVGESSLSGEAQITISGGGGGTTVPGAPANLAAIGTNSEIDLSWSAPSSDGGSAILHYEIYRGTSSGGETLYPATSAGTTFRNTANVVSGTTYYYKVKAVNAVGVGGFSNEASASLQAATTGMTPELLAAVMATLSKEVPGSFQPIEENGDFGMGPGCTYKISGACRGTPYDGGVDYKGRGYIQITHQYNYQTYCGADCIGNSTSTQDVCGCKNQWHCTVTDPVVCPMVKALEPGRAAGIFASFYNAHGLVSLANQKSYRAVGAGINGGTYPDDFKTKADAFLALFQANSSNTTTLIQCLNTNTAGCGPQVFPALFTYSSTLNTNLYQALRSITVSFGGGSVLQTFTKQLKVTSSGATATVTFTYTQGTTGYVVSKIDYVGNGFYGQVHASILDASTKNLKWSNTFWNFGSSAQNLYTGSLAVNSLDQLALFIKGWEPLFTLISGSDTGVFEVGNGAKPAVTDPGLTVYGVKVFSPVELRAYDAQGRVTGKIKGVIVENIPGSSYDSAAEMVLSTTPIVRYELVGTGNGVFGIVSVSSTQENPELTVQNIPVNTSEIITFTPSVGSIAVTVDQQGDGTVDATFNTSSNLTAEEFVQEVRLATCKVTFRTSSFDGTYGKHDWIAVDTTGDGTLDGFEFQNKNAAKKFCTDKKSVFLGKTLEGYSIWRQKEDVDKDEEDSDEHEKDSDDHEKDASNLLSVCNPADDKNRMLFHHKDSTQAVTDTKMVQGYETREMVACLDSSSSINSSNAPTSDIPDDFEIDTNHSDSDSTKKHFFLNLKNSFKEKHEGKKNVKIKADDQLVVEFPFDFSDNNTSNVSIELRNVGKGGASVKGIHLGGERKILHFPQLTDSNKICILDAEASLDEITTDCTGEHEYVITCDGSVSEQGYTCEIVDKTFTVHGLKHSAVSEFSGASSSSTASSSASTSSANNGGYGGGGSAGTPGEAFRGIVKRTFDEKKTAEEVKSLQSLAQKTVHEPVAQEKVEPLQLVEQEPVQQPVLVSLASVTEPSEEPVVAQGSSWLKWMLLPIALIVIGTLLFVKRRRRQVNP
ncbi:MAG: fibronectin type III domain-containing protein [Nanoarchaeota archaeon]